MVDPIPLLSPEQLERLKELADASRLRAARSQPPKPPQRRRRTRQYPSGKPNPRGSPRVTAGAAGDEPNAAARTMNFIARTGARTEDDVHSRPTHRCASR